MASMPDDWIEGHIVSSVVNKLVTIVEEDVKCINLREALVN